MEKKVIKRSDWKSSFCLVGTPEMSDKYDPIKTDQRGKNSDWIYNSMNLGVWCGEKYGTVYADCMGGYSESGNSVIYAHGKKEDGTDDFDTKITVSWEDRFNDDVLEKIGDMKFIKVGLELTNGGQIFERKFLSEYDAIAHVKKHLTKDMVICVTGNLEYSEYEGNVQAKKKITSIKLSIDNKTKQPTSPENFKATFLQSILIDKDSASLKNVDKDKGVMFVNARVLNYVKEVNGVEVKGQFPFNKQFEFELDLNNEVLCKAVYDKVFKVKKDITQITFEGDLIESGATVIATIDDITDDRIKSLIGIVYTEEEALKACVANNKKERRMVLRKPQIKLVGEDKTPIIQVFEERYTEDDLYLDYVYANAEKSESSKAESSAEKITEESTDNSMDWLNNL